MKYLRKEDGSTLLLVVITIAVLTVLGTTILSMSFMNYNMKFTDERMKKTLYYSESGIEQVYSIIGKYIDDALEDSSTNTELDLDAKEVAMITMLSELAIDTSALYADESKQDDLRIVYESAFSSLGGMSNADFMSSGLYLKALLASDPSYGGYATTFLRLQATGVADEIDVENASDPNRNLLVDHEIMIDTVEIVDYSKERMNFHYKAYFNSKVSEIETKVLDVNTYVFLDDNDTSTGSSIELKFTPDATHGNISSFSETGTNEFIINGLTSTFNYKGLTRKSITTDIIVTTPGDLIPLDLAQNKVIVDNNPLWQYALVTHNDLTFNGTNSTILGNVYALGNSPSGDYDLDPTNSNSPRNSANYDGIMLTGSSADVDITGDVVSQSYVQIGNNSSGNRLDINKGHVYCNSLVVQATSTNGSIYVNDGNVYTRDDIELNGTNSVVDIDGSYYGFMGSAYHYNQTSSIVINSDLTVGSSRLRITGKDLSTIMSNPEPAGRNGIIIAGVSYVNDIFDPDPYLLDNSKLYQSGESMGIKGNYIAYAFPTTETAGDAGLYNIDDLDPTTEGTSGLNLYYKFNAGSFMTVEDKAKYFKAISEDATIGSYISTGNSRIDISSSAYDYAAGAVIGSNSVMVKNLDSADHITSYSEKEIARDYVYIMNTLRHRPAGTYSSNFYNASGAGSNALDFITNADNAEVIDNYSLITEDEFDLDSGDISASVVSGPATAPARQVKIVESDPTSPYTDLDNFLLVGTGSYSYADGSTQTIAGDDYYVINADPSNPDEMQGIIVTSGKVRIAGDLHFYGSIIAIDDIYLENDNIDITNNDIEVKKYLAELVLTDTDLSHLFSENTLSTVGIALDKIEYIKDVTVGTGNIESLRQNYDEFIYYQNWRIAD